MEQDGLGSGYEAWLAAEEFQVGVNEATEQVGGGPGTFEHLLCPQTISQNTWVSTGPCWLPWSR